MLGKDEVMDYSSSRIPGSRVPWLGNIAGAPGSEDSRSHVISWAGAIANAMASAREVRETSFSDARSGLPDFRRGQAHAQGPG